MTLRLHRRENADPSRGFNVVLMFGMRALRDTSWTASIDLLFAADMTSGREVIIRSRAELALGARDEAALTELSSVLNAHLGAADRAGVRLFLDDDHELEMMERVVVSEA